MKKPIEEIMEKASKGKARVKHETDIYVDGYFVCDVLSPMGNSNDEDKANAALIAHCLREFPKLLEGAETMIDACKTGDKTIILGWCAQFAHIVKSASNVEVGE